MLLQKSLFLTVASALLAVTLHANTPQPVARQASKPADATRNAGNIIFDETGVFVANADAMPVDHFAGRLQKAGVRWIALQIDNTGNKRDDNIARLEAGWADQWRKL